jgi:hypothetical protein
MEVFLDADEVGSPFSDLLFGRELGPGEFNGHAGAAWSNRPRQDGTAAVLDRCTARNASTASFQVIVVPLLAVSAGVEEPLRSFMAQFGPARVTFRGGEQPY